MKTFSSLLLAFSLPLAVPAADQINPELQRGLFEEEANQNLDAAIKVYQSVLTTHDNERKLAATALFRLGECYRKLGRTNDAIAQYQRLSAEFADQSVLANLSRQNLAGLGVRATPTGTGDSGAAEQVMLQQRAIGATIAEAARVESLVKQLQDQSRADLRRVLPTVTPDALLEGLLQQLAREEQTLSDLVTTRTETHPEVKAVANRVAALNRQVDHRIDGILQGLKVKAEALGRESEILKQQLTGLPASGSAPAVNFGANASDPQARAKLKELLQGELMIAEQFAADQRKKVEAGVLAKGDEVRFERDVLNLRRQLVAVDGLVSSEERGRWRDLLLEEIKLAEEAVRLEKRKLDAGKSIASEVARLQRDVLILKRELVTFDGSPVPTPVTSAASAAAPTPEAEELARTERLLAQLQGWDLSQLRKLIPGVAPDAALEQLERDLATTHEQLRSLEAGGVNTEEKARRRDELRQQAAVQTDRIAMRAEEIRIQLEKRAAMLRERVARQPVQAASRANPVSAAALVPSAPTDEEDREVRRIQALIKDSPDLINAPNVPIAMWGESQRYGTPLHKAAQQGQLIVARFLIDNQADVNGHDGMGRTPLHWAAANGHKSMVELLLSRKADVQAAVSRNSNSGSQGFTALHFATQSGYRGVCEVLANAGADLNASSVHNGTALHIAATRNFRTVAELLLDKGASARALDKNDDTPLHTAAGAGARAVVELLLARNVDVNARAKEGATALLRAAQNKHLEVVRVLLGAKADPNLKLDGPLPNSPSQMRLVTPLVTAVNAGDTAMARLLLENGADPGVLSNRRGWTLLHQAVSYGNLELVEALLSHGADVNAKTSDDGYTPLAAIVENLPGKAAEIAALLLKHKADPNLARTDGTTPLMSAVAKRDKDAVKLLLDHGAEVNSLRQDGNTPLSLIKPGRQSGLNAGFGGPVPPSIPARALRAPEVGGVPGQSESAAVDPAPEIIALLEQRGARDDLQRLTAISVSRNQENRRGWLLKGTNDWNRFTLLELIALINPRRDVSTGFDFPDMSRVAISRMDPRTAKTEDLRVDLVTVLTNSDCAKDLPLEWGDVVDIPELDHFVDARWDRFPDAYYKTFQKCLERTVRVSIKGQTNTIVLLPFRPMPGGLNHWEQRMSNFRLNRFLRGSGLLLTSSDVTRVKVKRADPATGEVRERVFDLAQINQRNDDINDLWLRDGDVIEVPEK